MAYSLVNDRRVHRVIDEYANCIAPPGQFNRILVQFCFQKSELHIVFTAIVFKGRFVISLGIKESNLDHFPASQRNDEATLVYSNVSSKAILKRFVAFTE